MKTQDDNHSVNQSNSEPCTTLAVTNNQYGKVGWALLWLLGVPLPILLIIYALRGCH